MKNFSLLLLASILISISLPAQNTDDDHEYSRPFRTKVGGAGGVTPIVTMFDNSEIDKFLKSANLPTLGSDPMYLVGGEGYGYIMFLKNVRMGGFGATGSTTISVIENVPSVGQQKKEVKYSISEGGFLIDYVMPVADRLDIAIGGSIGGGSVELRMNKDDGKFKDWNGLWSEYGNDTMQTSNYTRVLNGSFGVFNPRVSIEYTILPWFQLRVGASYPVFFSPEWKLDDNFTVDNVPSGIKPKGVTINGGIMFGFFGW